MHQRRRAAALRPPGLYPRGAALDAEGTHGRGDSGGAAGPAAGRAASPRAGQPLPGSARRPERGVREGRAPEGSGRCCGAVGTGAVT